MASKIPIVLWLLLLGFSCIILIGNIEASDAAAWEANISICFDFVCRLLSWWFNETGSSILSLNLNCCKHYGQLDSWPAFKPQIHLLCVLSSFGYMILFAGLYPKVDIISCSPILFIWATFQRVTSLCDPCTQACCNKFLAGCWHHKFVCRCFNYPQFITLDKLLGLV